jgi:hypothetical protein
MNDVLALQLDDYIYTPGHGNQAVRRRSSGEHQASIHSNAADLRLIRVQKHCAFSCSWIFHLYLGMPNFLDAIVI